VPTMLRPTTTEEEQKECERVCRQHIREAVTRRAQLVTVGLLDADGKPRLMREKHVTYLKRGLATLGPGYVALDASRPWLLYWILHSLDVLDALPVDRLPACCETLALCQNPGGGFGGGPYQLSHCAPTYAAVLALCLMGTDQALGAVDRGALYAFFLSVKDASGGFRMHEDGEIDVRGTYTVVAVAALLNMLTPELAAGVAEYVMSCQSYEGGFGGEPGSEAHGGYVFCAVAALVILGATAAVDLDALERWLCRRQMAVEGGFQGRTNKLVDGCYSFWQGATVVLVELVRRGASLSPSLDFAPTDPDAAATTTDEARPAYASDLDALEQYILLCAQQLPDGGLRDKPGKPRDYYHTCYCLSALGVYGIANAAPVHPIFNIRSDKVRRVVDFFASRPSAHVALLRS